MSKKLKKTRYPEIFERIEAKHEFSDVEKIELLDQLSLAHQTAASLEDQAKQSSADWKNRIKAEKNKIADISNKAASGYELRPVECRVEFDPKKGIKHYVNRKTKEKIETRDMIPNELALPLSDGKKEPAANLVSVEEAFPEQQEEQTEE